MWIFIKRIFRLPVTRYDILKCAKKRAIKYPETYGGICNIITDTLLFDFGLSIECFLKDYFPKFTYENALKFGAIPEHEHMYWWKYKDWKGDRMKFLNWLIQEYKDDKTDLRELSKSFIATEDKV